MSKVAILIDGGYFLKRLPTVFKSAKPGDPESVAWALRRLIAAHLKSRNRIEKLPHERALLYRSFFYDAKPYLGKEHRPVSGKSIDYARSDEAKFRLALHDKLRRMSHMAVRLGEVRRERGWILREEAQKRLLKGEIKVADLTDDDFTPGLRQKAVDMRIGTDIASLTLKRQVDTIILVAGDSDFVPASKLARREGVKVVLDPLWRSVAPELFEHIDGLQSGFPKPGTAAAKKAEKDEDVE
ncbi:NYN domain-containing protein [Defluviimonas sp. WL0002]|uniref:NYN domain-containing protein n=1 Tax=Albidovulum marisflavi TaxID=2984159 RepID=A0ABT2Z8I0_9RHOB|nr:NYN domain-containing protein [Defluviimonas sp. WL0002]MCV2867432.1 NYN domain-containing protein [Defluviimonas sp. WL0002]